MARNPDRTRWKEAMRLRRERFEAMPKPPFAFVCTAACFSSFGMMERRSAMPALLKRNVRTRTRRER